MLLLTSTSDLLQVVTGSAATVDVHASWVDNNAGVITPGRTNTAIASAATTTVVASPGASIQRTVNTLLVHNKSATLSDLITVQHFDGTITVNLFSSTLQIGEMAELGSDGIWRVFDATGAIKTTGAVGPAGSQGIQGIQGFMVEGADGSDGSDSFVPGPPGSQGIPGSPGSNASSFILLMDGDSGADGDNIVGPPGPSGQVGTSLINGLEVWGHSWVENPLTATLISSLTDTTGEVFPRMFASAIGVRQSQYVLHALSGAQITGATRPKGFAKVLSEIFRVRQTTPFARSGGAHLFCYGINDIGNNTAANQALVRSTMVDIMTVCISKCRASAIFNANGGANLVFGANFSNAAVAATDWTSGFAKQCTVVDSAGTSTVTFTIPIGYHGEPICFALGGLQAGSLVVTWGGTAGITGTTTLNSRSINSNSIVPFRITTLTSASAGQTITCAVTTISGSTFYFDGVWIEATKAVPVLVCNVPRLPQKVMTWASGAGVTTGVNTSFTDASVQFSSAGGWLDTGATLTETDAQGAFTGNTNTISSVTNATTVVLGTNAASAKSSIKYTIARVLNGYASGLYWNTNTNFTGATVGSHSAADTDIQNWNTSLASVIALFDSMVQMVDLDAVIGGDLTVPSNIYTFWDQDGGHMNALGNMACAQAVMTASLKLSYPFVDYPGPLLQTSAVAVYEPGPYRRPVIATGAVYLPDGAIIAPVANLYTAVAGDCFAFPFMVTEQSVKWTTAFMDQANAGNTVLRAGIYLDTAGINGMSGYPQVLNQDAGNFTMNGVAAVNTVATFNRVPYPGLNWLVIAIQTIGATPSTFYSIYGAALTLSGWNGAHLGVAANALQPICWKITGLAAGALPNTFPTGGVQCGVAISQTANAAPLVGVTQTIL